MKPEDNPPPLKTLEEDIARFQTKTTPAPVSKPQGFTGAMRTGLELISGVLVGSAVGIVLDKWLGTSPAFFIACFLLGACGGFLTVYRTMQAMDKETDAQPLPPMPVDDDEDE